MPATRLVKVRLDKKDYLVPHSAGGLDLVRITSHPLDSEKVLVWRRRHIKRYKVSEDYDIYVREARREGDELREGKRIADLVYYTSKGRGATAWDFDVSPEFRRKTLGSALLETMLQHLRKEGVGKVSFPGHKEEGFYLKRGFEKGYRRFVGDVEKLGVKPAGIKLKVLWQRAKPRFGSYGKRARQG